MTSHFARRRQHPASDEPEGSLVADLPRDPAAESPPVRRVKISLDQREIRIATVRILLIISAWLAAAWVVGVAQHFLFLILLAWLLAIAAEPATRWFLRRGISRSRATAIVGTCLIVVIAGLAVLFERALFDQSAQLVQSLPATVTSVVDQLNSTFGLHLDAVQITDSLRLQPNEIQGVANDLAVGILAWFGSLLSVAVDLVTVVVFAFYIAAAGPKLVQQLAVWLPPDRQLVLVAVWDTAEQKTGGYVASKVVLAAISAFFHGVFFWAIGLPGWLPLGLLAGITAQFIPVIGTYIGVAVPVLVALAEKPVIAVWIVLFAIVYQQIETYILTPRISRRTMHVNPAIALAAVFIGAAIWGPIGAIIGVPIAAVVVSIVETYGRRYQLIPHLTSPGDSSEASAGPESSGQGTPS